MKNELTDPFLSVPRYDELPEAPDRRGRCSWGVFGAEDQLGALNLVTPERVLRALREPRIGRTVNLSLPLDQPSPVPTNRGPYRHEIFSPGPNTLDERIHDFYPQASSQWDGFRHIRAGVHGWYNGFQEPEVGPTGDALGIHVQARRGITTRGVLVDVAAYRESIGEHLRADSPTAITPEEIEKVLTWQNAALAPGDVLVIRTGWLQTLLDSSEDERVRLLDRNGSWPGLHPGEETARFLWNNGVVAVAADNRTVEMAPGLPGHGFLHRRLLAFLGILIGEMWDLTELSAVCRQTGRYTFLLLSVPLNLPRGVGSPANALAVL